MHAKISTEAFESPSDVVQYIFLSDLNSTFYFDRALDEFSDPALSFNVIGVKHSLTTMKSKKNYGNEIAYKDWDCSPI